jgi:hypothetical protein
MSSQSNDLPTFIQVGSGSGVGVGVGTSLLNDGRKIPNLAFGTGSVMKGSDVSGYVTSALKAGFIHIDTAQAYRNEASVGEGLENWISIRKRRHDGDVEKSYYEDVEKSQCQPRSFQGLQERGDVWVTTKYSGGPKGPLEELKDSLSKVTIIIIIILHSLFFMLEYSRLTCFSFYT